MKKYAILRIPGQLEYEKDVYTIIQSEFGSEDWTPVPDCPEFDSKILSGLLIDGLRREVVLLHEAETASANNQ